MSIVATVPYPMADKDATKQTPPSETVRVQGDLMEILRDLCFHTRDERGKRYKIAGLVDEILRPELLRRHAEMQEEQKKPRKKSS